MASNDILVVFVVSCVVMTVHSASLEMAAPIEITTVPPLVTVKPGCVWNGQWYPEGPEFRPDACTFCHCFQGRPMCAVADCFIPPCVDPVRDPNQCCPTCPNGNNCRAPDGTIIPAGQTVNISSTTICTCPNSGFLMSNQAVCAIAPPDVTVMAHIAD